MISSSSNNTNTKNENDTFYGWVCPGKGQPLEWRKLSLKTFENDNVEIKITHCGICATDLHVMNSDWGPTDYPFVGGHEQELIVIHVMNVKNVKIIKKTYAVKVLDELLQGSVVGVIGIGGLGHFAIQWAKALGAKVIIFSTSNEKRKDAEMLGADEFILTTSNNNMGGSNPYLLSHMILCTSFGIHEFNWSYYLSFMEPNGTFILTTAPEAFLNGIPVHLILQRQLSIVGAAVGSPKEIQEMLIFVNEHLNEIKPWIEKIYSMDQIEEAIQVVKKGQAKYRVVLQV
ncbi:hypothetical protein INT45_008977 [Circinella minor]|uniref:Alcohol dehydrogenase-like C-terminal domain-containing protein n=1 Tax=Circinella minor TaxID=1195481 RepID=A0A8H7S728_9FUNG|nr:hypothetical protein INT45_008977 [Circinella minor]